MKYIILFFIVLFILLLLLYNNKKNKIKSYREKLSILENKIKNTEIDIEKLARIKENLTSQISALKESQDIINSNILIETKNLETIKKNIEDTWETKEEVSRKAFEVYCDILDNDYVKKNNEYEILIQTLKDKYDSIIAETDKVQKELDKIRSSRAAIIQARIREKEIEENSSFYCLQISDIEKADIDKLMVFKKTLNNQRILSMLIWQTYYQKPLKMKSAEILGTKDVTGIYKITNIVTKECYIGQAKNVATRWTEHAKCGLGIDTPASNKLYKAMLEYGLYNFSWELLEECPADQLNEKERYYIELYNSYNYGYNSSRGIGIK